MYLQIVRTISSIIKSFLLSIPTNRFGIFLLQVQNFVALNSNGLIIHFLICSMSPYECSCWYRMSFNFRYSICNINRIKNLQVHPLHSLCLVSVYSFLFFFAFHWNRKWVKIFPRTAMFHIFTSQQSLPYPSVSLLTLSLSLCNRTKRNFSSFFYLKIIIFCPISIVTGLLPHHCSHWESLNASLIPFSAFFLYRSNFRYFFEFKTNNNNNKQAKMKHLEPLKYLYGPNSLLYSFTLVSSHFICNSHVWNTKYGGEKKSRAYNVDALARQNP